MGTFALAARVLLAAVFATAGIAKLRDKAGTWRALQEFGLPPGPAVPIIAVALPVAELATAAALLPTATARWGALGALALLLIFIAVIAKALAAGRAPDCHCFGQVHSSPAGRRTLARNALLTALAAAVLVDGPGPAIDTWVTDRSAAELAAVGIGVLALALATEAFRLWRENRVLQRELEIARAGGGARSGLPEGFPAPDFALPDLRGETVTLESLLERGNPVALVFADPTCGICGHLLPELGEWQGNLVNDLTVALISRGKAEDNQLLEDDYGITNVLLQKRAEVLHDYRLDGTPSAVVISRDGTIASESVAGIFAIEPLLRVTLKRHPRAA